MRFRVMDNKTGKEADPYEIALHEEWARSLVYCDMEGFAITEDGDLVLMDECGTCVYCDPERFKVVFEDERPQWIPCSERLPEIRFDLNSRTSDTVFVCLENRTMHMAFYCCDGIWRFCESGESKEPMWDKVIAWMPLPERYGEEAKTNESDHL